MPTEYGDSGSERELVAALLYFEHLASACIREGRHDLALLMEDHASDTRVQLVSAKQPAYQP
jgi:hypothetical protein